MDWKKFNKSVDLEALKNDIKEAQENGGEFEKTPYGEYIVGVEKMELKETKKGDPMISIWLKVSDGKMKGKYIFYNQVITKGFQIHLANEFLRSLDSAKEVVFEDYEQYNNLILDIHEEIANSLEYKISYEEEKGYDKVKVLEVYEVPF